VREEEEEEEEEEENKQNKYETRLYVEPCFRHYCP
jgi:hypothetical protein